ncbi:MAG: hypothetical protein WA376_20910, partial [Terrimicrobiaceae bacterium]
LIRRSLSDCERRLDRSIFFLQAAASRVQAKLNLPLPSEVGPKRPIAASSSGMSEIALSQHRMQALPIGEVRSHALRFQTGRSGFLVFRKD